MTVSLDIADYAKSFGIGVISTGGGFDYAWREFPNGSQAIVAGTTRDGSPESLDEPATICIYFTDTWTNGLILGYDSARAAITALSLMDYCPR